MMAMKSAETPPAGLVYLTPAVIRECGEAILRVAEHYRTGHMLDCKMERAKHLAEICVGRLSDPAWRYDPGPIGQGEYATACAVTGWDTNSSKALEVRGFGHAVRWGLICGQFGAAMRDFIAANGRHKVTMRAGMAMELGQSFTPFAVQPPTSPFSDGIWDTEQHG